MANPPIRQQVMKYLAAQFPGATLADHQLGADGLLAIFEAEAARVRAEAARASAGHLALDVRPFDHSRGVPGVTGTQGTRLDSPTGIPGRQGFSTRFPTVLVSADGVVELTEGAECMRVPVDRAAGWFRAVADFLVAAGSVPVATPPEPGEAK